MAYILLQFYGAFLHCTLRADIEAWFYHSVQVLGKVCRFSLTQRGAAGGSGVKVALCSEKAHRFEALRDRLRVFNLDIVLAWFAHCGLVVNP